MPLNLPDKLPAIELLKEENIFVITRYPSATNCYPQPDAVEDYDRNRLGAFTLKHSASGGNFFYED